MTCTGTLYLEFCRRIVDALHSSKPDVAIECSQRSLLYYEQKLAVTQRGKDSIDHAVQQAYQHSLTTRSMPKRLQTAIKRLALKRTGRSKDDTQPSQKQDDTSINPQASFLGLPAEIRNQIYEELAMETTLLLWPTKDRKSPPPIGLLLACHQTHREYRAVLFANAQVLITVAEYNFSNLVRVLEKLTEADIESLKLNPQLWILLNVSHVPTRDDRRNLRGWCDYRGSKSSRPYFGPGRVAANDLLFEYDVKFLNHIRPPRPMCRYANGYQMKLDLLRSHLRMYNRLKSVAEEEESPNAELKQLRDNISQCIGMFEDLHIQRFEQSLRTSSVSTIQSTQSVQSIQSDQSTITGP